MPYIVTTKRQWAYHSMDGVINAERISRHPVATLDEARDYVHQQGATFAVASISESGGTVGPLPDGTVIEVERVP